MILVNFFTYGFNQNSLFKLLTRESRDIHPSLLHIAYSFMVNFINNNVAIKIRGSMFKQKLARELWELENSSDEEADDAE